MARLILLEGIPGSGKTTLTSRLCALLREAGTPCAAWLEGQSGHPVELEHHACLTQEEYAALCAEFPGEAGALAAHAHAEGDFLLVRYLEDRAPVFSGALLSHLMAREFRYALAPCIPLASYTAVSLSRGRSLAAEWAGRPGFLLLESAFLQHPVQDLLLHYALPDEEIIAFLRRAADALTPLSPVLFYLAPKDVAATLANIAEQRGAPEMAYPDSIAFWAHRQALELSALPQLPFDTHVLCNSSETPEQTALRMRMLLPTSHAVEKPGDCQGAAAP